MFILKNAKGFTLIEMLIAVTILTIVLLSFVPLIVTAMGINRTVSLHAMANALASQKIDELKAMTSQDLQTCLGTGSACSKDEGIVKTEWGINFNRTWTVQQMPVIVGVTMNRPYIITVTIQYNYRGEQFTRIYTSVWGL